MIRGGGRACEGIGRGGARSSPQRGNYSRLDRACLPVVGSPPPPIPTSGEIEPRILASRFCTSTCRVPRGRPGGGWALGAGSGLAPLRTNLVPLCRARLDILGVAHVPQPAVELPAEPEQHGADQAPPAAAARQGGEAAVPFAGARAGLHAAPGEQPGRAVGGLHRPGCLSGLSRTWRSATRLANWPLHR